MKNKITPIDRGRDMTHDDFIVSKTDAKGCITYANLVFIEFSQYDELELIGKQHNIVRHPDMPRAVFHYMWTCLQRGDEFFGYIKNMAKDGSYYWTMANVTPSQNHGGELLGYFSVRRKPRKRAVTEFASLYREMLAEEKRAGPKEAISAGTLVLEHYLEHNNIRYEQHILAY